VSTVLRRALSEQPGVVLATVVTVAGLTGAVIHMIEPDLTVDSIVVSLLVIAIAPWLGLIFKSLEVPGVGKGEFRDLIQKTVKEEVDKRVDIVDTGVEAAVQDAQNEFSKSEKEKYVKRQEEGRPKPPRQQLDELIREYNLARSSEAPGSQRTSHMTRIVRDMIALADHLPGFDWSRNLESPDRGERLAAYSFLYKKPTESAGIPLVDTLAKVEDKPFGQYWALRALERQLDRIDCNSAKIIKDELDSFVTKSLQPATDRYILSDELRDTIRELVKDLCQEELT
jgi:hypothetical protein